MLVDTLDQKSDTSSPPVPQSQLRVRSDLHEEYSSDEIAKMTELYEGTLSNIEEGEIVKSKVLRVTDTSVILDVGFKSEGAVPIDEFKDPHKLKEGDEIEVFLEHLEDQEGAVVLSYHWRRPDGSVYRWDGVRTPLDRSVMPGETYETELAVLPPGTQGHYVLELDLVREGVGWFGAAAPLAVTVLFSVSADPAFSLPIHEVTLAPYVDLVRDDAWRSAAINSVMVGLGATSVALLAGFGAALAIVRNLGRGATYLRAVVLYPFAHRTRRNRRRRPRNRATRFALPLPARRPRRR